MSFLCHGETLNQGYVNDKCAQGALILCALENEGFEPIPVDEVERDALLLDGFVFCFLLFFASKLLLPLAHVD